jgi:hypothetical protein
LSRYASPAAFRQALEGRLQRLDASPLDTKRTFLALQRFLVRVASVREDVLLKGGLGLKLRVRGARATRDLDLRMSGDRDADQQVLTDAARLELPDFFAFSLVFKSALIGTTGNRFQATCRIAGRPFAVFDVDAAADEPVWGAPDAVAGSDWLSFIDIATPYFQVYPLSSQIAEKLHALTLPRSRPNSRTRDLPDLAFLGQCADGLAQATLREALEVTFTHRATHPIPSVLPPPPREWAQAYRELVDANALPWRTLDAVQDAVERFLSPVLSGSGVRRWSASVWAWE